MKFKLIGLTMLPVLMLSSCTVNKRTNVIVPGIFYGIDTSNESISCILKVESISESDFKMVNGTNVIQDQINNEKYFSIEFNVYDDKGNKENYTFLNLKDAYDGDIGTPISYVDDQGFWLNPITSENNKVLSYADCYYNIHIINSKINLEIFTYLYAMED